MNEKALRVTYAIGVRADCEAVWLKPARPHGQLDLTFLLACLLGVLDVLMFGSIVLNAGPPG